LRYPLIFLCISIASARLNNTGFAERSELIQVVSDSRENHFDMDSSDRSYENMSRLEDDLDYVSTAVETLADDSQRYSEWPLPWRSYLADLQVLPSISRTQRMTSRRPPHGCRFASGRCSKIALITVDGFTLSRQIYLAIIN
jgi:hypothetical protein